MLLAFSLSQALRRSPRCVRRDVFFRRPPVLVRMFQRKISILMPAFLTLGILLAPHAYAQLSGATLSGTVTDPSGGVVPQATILLKNIATGIQRANTTNSAGFYVSPNILPGTYEVRAEAKGFSSEVQT